jgi:hypothetical protein
MTKLNSETFDGLLRQRSDNLVDIAATRTGRLDSEAGAVRQDHPRAPAGCPRHALLPSLQTPAPSHYSLEPPVTTKAISRIIARRQC